ncbi:hypothetical protein RHGRI_027296 [Rhododendron griersonianum]|uniref:SWIM-type domain-containing protein n=1 Tax=Rhododendron griersonianum TaxID=479676 RepID=A0AAV6IVZ5_9ERIC|nr:hypothetical protein RHGRI_027296 [Rhododendron griersonianum]
MCKFGEVTLVVMATRGFGFNDLVESIYRKWQNLGSFELFYAVADHHNCILDNDEDFCSMIALAAAYGVTCVDVSVGVICSSTSECVKSLGGQNGECVRSFEYGECSTFQGEEEDPLDKFCIHHETVRLSADWVNLLKCVGQEFRGGVDDFKACLSKYAVEVGFKYKYLKNDRSRVTAECCKKLDGCTWFIHATLERSNKFFVIREFHKEHNCLGTFFSSKNPRMTSKIIAKEIVEKVRSKPSYTPIECLKHFEGRYGCLIGYYHAWLAVEKANKELYGDFQLSFDKLRWYAEELKEKNPGTVMDVEYCNETNRFIRFFLAFDACIKGFNYCRPILAVDGTFLKGRYKGTLLAAIGKDADQGLFPLAIGVVDSETEANWQWFLEKLSTVITCSRPLTFFTDRHSGLVKYVPTVFPTGYHSYCLQHLKGNLRDKLSGRLSNGFREKVVNLFNDCAHAPTVITFAKALEELCTVGGASAKNFVESLPRERWANAYFEGRRYGEMTSNAAESFNNQILKFRHLPICELVDKIRVLIMEQMCNRRLLSNKLSSYVCPVMEKKLVDHFNKGRTWHVAAANDDIFEVFSQPTVVVDLKKRTCTCCRWQIHLFPCVHAVTVIQKTEKQMHDYIDPYYTIEAIQLSYEGTINPVPTLGAPVITKESAIILPPKTRRPRGRPKVGRIRSRGEKVRQMLCGRCGKLGKHNRRTCKEAVD